MLASFLIGSLFGEEGSPCSCSMCAGAEIFCTTVKRSGLEYAGVIRDSTNAVIMPDPLPTGEIICLQPGFDWGCKLWLDLEATCDNQISFTGGYFTNEKSDSFASQTGGTGNVFLPRVPNVFANALLHLATSKVLATYEIEYKRGQADYGHINTLGGHLFKGFSGIRYTQLDQRMTTTYFQVGASPPFNDEQYGFLIEKIDMQGWGGYCGMVCEVLTPCGILSFNCSAGFTDGEFTLTSFIEDEQVIDLDVLQKKFRLLIPEYEFSCALGTKDMDCFCLQGSLFCGVEIHTIYCMPEFFNYIDATCPILRRSQNCLGLLNFFIRLNGSL